MAEDAARPWQGERLLVLGDLKGLTQSVLATRLGVSQSFVSLVSKGQKPLPEAVAIRASREFRVPLSFFTVTDGPTSLGHHTFRKRASASSRDERRVKALFDEAARMFFDVSAASGYKSVDLPSPTDHDMDPEECAEAVREAAGLEVDEPVPNVTRLIERRGIGVITHLDDRAGETLDHDAISKPHQVNDRPLIALAHDLSGGVQRLSLGHELGHLIFDVGLTAPIPRTRAHEESRAFRFAGALLLPERVVRDRVTSTLALHGYLRIKAEYGISVAAIIRRARDLGVITTERHRSLSIQLSSQGWRRHEPVEVTEEMPQLVRQALKKVHGPRMWQVAPNFYGIDPHDLTRWIPPAHREDALVHTNVVNLQFGTR